MLLKRQSAPALALIITALGLVACSDNDDNSPDAGNSNNDIVVPLSSDQEVPPVIAAGASGEGLLQIDADTGAISGSVSVSGLTGTATAAHIHQALAGRNGPIVLELSGNEAGTLWTVPADSALDAARISAYQNGELYINVHTAANMSGELRGQIIPDGITVIRSTLSGDQEVPPVSTNASGVGVVTLNESTRSIDATVINTGVDNATAAHIHEGARGANGGVLVGLVQDTEDPGIWRTDSSDPATVLTEEQASSLLNGGTYFNVHTPANPSGEIRGQIVPEGVSSGQQSFTVRIDNVSNENTLPTPSNGGSVAVPLSPGAYVVHQQDRNPLLDPRSPASAALEALAEDGDASLFPDFVSGAGVFNTPVGASEPGPIGPGGYYSFTITASPGDELALATMFVQSNDWFYSTNDDNNDSIPLFDASGNPISGDVSDQLDLWETETELDEEPGTGPNQAPRQTGPNTGITETGSVGSLAGKGKSVTLNGPVIRVTITPVNASASVY